MRRAQIAAACLLILSVACSAAVLNVPAEYPSIQSAVVAASSGDTVLVAPGVYLEEFDYLGRRVTVGSRYLTTGDPSFIDSTIVDGEGARGPLVTFASGEDSLSALVGVTLRDGRAAWGGGVFCDLSAPRISHCVFLSNEATSDGGGLCANEADPIIEHCRFEGNTAVGHSGGGLWIWSGSPRVTGCVFEDNSAHDEGGAILAQDSSAAIRDNVIDGNSTLVSYAGGIMCRNCTPVIEGNVVTNNQSSYLGGGLFY